MSGEDYKILGEQGNTDGAGVVGHNTATSGDAVGVKGVTDSPDGHGLYTPDDARVDGNLSASRVNGVRWARSPDDIDTQLQKLPDYGGVVRLRPGQYDDTDWTTPIELPNNNDKTRTLTIDMRGSRIDLDSFNPDQPYISRTVSQHQPLHVTLYGPDSWNVQGLTEPPSAVRLYDVELSYVYLPYLSGPFEYAVEKISEYASGHFCRIFAHGYDVRSGFKIGDTDAGQTSDRSFYVGQFGRVTNYGAKIERGKWNTVYAQVENTDGDGPGYGYYIEPLPGLETAGNRLKIQERGADIPFYVMTTRCRFDLVGGIAEDAWSKSRHVVPPERVHDVSLTSETFEWSTDRRGEFDIGGSDPSTDTDDDGTTVIKPYRALRLKAGPADGADTYVQTVANATGANNYFSRVWGHVNPISQSDAVHRFGIWDDDDNHVVAEADVSPNGDGNWHLVVTQGGTRRADVNTTVGAVTGGMIVSVGVDGSEQFLAVRDTGTQNFGHAGADVDITDFGNTDMRADVTVATGDGSQADSARAFDVRKFAYER